MSESTICIFANFYIDNEERLQRMKDSFQSIRELDPFEWRINIRGGLKEKAGLFLLSALGTRLDLNYINGKKGWFNDSNKIMEGCKTDYVFFWVEDHICLVKPDIIRKVVDEMTELRADQCLYSFLHKEQIEIFQVSLPDRVGSLIDVWNIDKKFALTIKRVLGRDFYVTSMLTIMRQEVFFKILQSQRPFLSRWPIHFPFDFEKKYKDKAIREIRTAVPKLEIFACIDDDHGVDGYSLISRGLYQNNISRAELKRIEFSSNSRLGNSFFDTAKNTNYSRSRLFSDGIITFFNRMTYTFNKFKNFML